MIHNFLNQSTDPTPADTPDNLRAAHGTNVAGIIGAIQNGIGVMGIAPKSTLGGALLTSLPESSYTPTTYIEAYGGANFSKKADIINASFGVNPASPVAYDTDISTSAPFRALSKLRSNKGAIFLKATGNEFLNFSTATGTRDCPTEFSGIFSCENPAHDTDSLEPTVINVASASARGIKATYSSAGSLNWVTGLGGELATSGSFGESIGVDAVGQPDSPESYGPLIFSSDLQGCSRGYSRSVLTEQDPSTLFAQGLSSFKNIKNNDKCNYSHMNGTSSATPTLSGVTALILQANPNLTWRDVREIIRRSSRAIDQNYPARIKANRLVDLTTGTLSTTAGSKEAFKDGATLVPLEFGWQTNSAGIKHSNWYGFGLIDANAAVKLAKSYRAGSLKSELTIPDFTTAFPNITNLSYKKVTKLGTVQLNQANLIDQFQLRVSGPICVGSVGFFVKSPSGVISPLSIPYNIFYKDGISQAINYGLGSYAFYGEEALGQWEIFAVSGDKGKCKSEITTARPLKVEYRIISQLSS